MEASQEGAPEQERQETQAEDDQVIVGDQGEQVATDALGGIGQDTPVATSAPSPDRQSGVPLAEDREAGVEPGPVHPGDERPEGSDQTAASPAEPAE